MTEEPGRPLNDHDRSDIQRVNDATNASELRRADDLKHAADDVLPEDSVSVSDPRDESRRPTWQIRFVRKLPLHLIATPERVVLNVAFLLTGLASILPPRGQTLSAMPYAFLIIYSVGMTAGAIAVLIGLFRNKRPLERVGYLMVLIACVIFSWYTLDVRGLAGLPIALVFIGFGVMKALRLIISSAEREMVVEVGRRMRDRERHYEEIREQNGGTS